MEGGPNSTSAVLPLEAAVHDSASGKAQSGDDWVHKGEGKGEVTLDQPDNLLK